MLSVLVKHNSVFLSYAITWLRLAEFQMYKNIARYTEAWGLYFFDQLQFDGQPNRPEIG